MWVCMENMNEKHRKSLLKIQVTHSTNLEIHDKHGENELWLEANANQKVCGYLRKIDKYQKAAVNKWKFFFKHTLVNFIK